MLRRFVSNSVFTRVARPTVYTQNIHSQESAYYERQENLKKKLLELKDELAPKAYTPDSAMVSFAETALNNAKNSAKLQSLGVDPRQVADSDAVHQENSRVVY